MEKCFIIESSAKLHERYYAYNDLWEKNHKAIKKFVAENITEAKGYSYSAYDDFAITLNDETYSKFSSQLKKDYRYVAGKKLYTFKKRSPIGKLYSALNIKPAFKPNPLWEASMMSGRNRLFDYEGTLYATVDSNEINKETVFPDGWREISRGEFYALLDKIEKETD